MEGAKSATERIKSQQQATPTKRENRTTRKMSRGVKTNVPKEKLGKCRLFSIFLNKGGRGEINGPQQATAAKMKSEVKKN